MKSFLPDYNISKVLLDSAHDAMPYYQYFKEKNITPFIDLNDILISLAVSVCIKMTLPSIMMVFLFVLAVVVYVGMALKLQRAG